MIQQVPIARDIAPKPRCLGFIGHWMKTSVIPSAFRSRINILCVGVSTLPIGVATLSFAFGDTYRTKSA
jgi:hypothetical protein